MRKKQKDFWSFLYNKKTINNTYNYKYAINFSVGMIFGFFIDKYLLILSKGFTVFVPFSFTIYFMTKGKTLYSLKFDKEIKNRYLKKILKHFITKL